MFGGPRCGGGVLIIKGWRVCVTPAGPRGEAVAQRARSRRAVMVAASQFTGPLGGGGDVDDAVTRVICSPMNLVNVLFARSWPGTSFQEVGCFFGLSLHTNRHAAKTTKLILKRVEIQ